MNKLYNARYLFLIEPVNLSAWSLKYYFQGYANGHGENQRRPGSIKSETGESRKRKYGGYSSS